MEVAEFEASICDPCTACKGRGWFWPQEYYQNVAFVLNPDASYGKSDPVKEVFICGRCDGSGLDRDRIAIESRASSAQ